MAWLVGAIVTYGIVVLLIGIAVVVFLLGGPNRVAAGATRDDPVLRRRPDRQIAPAMPRQGAAAGTEGSPCVSARFVCGGKMTSLTRPGPSVGYDTGRQPAWAARDRAAHYREQAAQFERMAAGETQATSRDRLLDLAQQYDRLAAKLDSQSAPVS